METNSENSTKREVTDESLVPQAFLRVVSHDLQIDLQALLTDAEMLSNELSTPKPNIDRLRKDARDILSRVEILIAITHNLRATRLDLDYEWSLFDLDNSIRSVIHTISSVAAERGLSIEYKSEMRGSPKIKGAPRLVTQVLFNLLMNAIKYSYHRRDATSSIVVRLKDQGSDVEIEIQNRGMPIGEDEKELIFEKGYRGSMAAQMRTPGSGLGLYVAKTIVEKHHGGLTIASKLQERNEAVVTVTVRLPRETSEE